MFKPLFMLTAKWIAATTLFATLLGPNITVAATRAQTANPVTPERQYGRLLPWPEADRIFNRYSIFSVQDVETGLSFQVQRRAGHDHADVQPVTREDTKVMKLIYGGQWSWKRRAIVVRMGEERVAASMNGMPHGGDGIPDNDFSGHFCIHFMASTTHKSKVPDVAHQMMVYKAAGQSRAYINVASPERLAEVFVQAMNEQDPEWVRLLTEGMTLIKQNEVLRKMSTLAAVRSISPRRQNTADAVDALVTTLTWSVDMYPSEEGRRKATWSMQYIRASFFSTWQLNELLFEPESTSSNRGLSYSASSDGSDSAVKMAKYRTCSVRGDKECSSNPLK